MFVMCVLMRKKYGKTAKMSMKSKKNTKKVCGNQKKAIPLRSIWQYNAEVAQSIEH